MADATTIHIAKIDSERLRIPIVGTTPLIVHNFSAKSKQQMLDSQQGRKTPKVARDPQQLVPIIGEPKMREDVVRLGGPSRSADLRYRPEFREWSTVLEVTYVRSSLTRDSVLSLIDAGGMGIGVGEWRPEKRGEFGTYAVDLSRPVEVVA